MKTKRLSKKLALTRETVANLNGIEMKAALGGTGLTYFSDCPKKCPEPTGGTSCNPCPCLTEEPVC
jgi:hypothetical protein